MPLEKRHIEYVIFIIMTFESGMQGAELLGHGSGQG